MTATLTLTTAHSSLLTLNQRLHRMESARRTKLLRNQGAMVVRSMRPEPMQRAHLTVTVSWPDGRRRDVHNLLPTIKGHIDGMVTDGGLLPDDDDKHLIGPDLRVSDERAISGTVRLVYVFEEVTP